jgi:flagellar basal body rod protein FlgC
MDHLNESARKALAQRLHIASANIAAARTRRQAFARFHSYTRWVPTAAYREELEAVLMQQLHRIDARASAKGGAA